MAIFPHLTKTDNPEEISQINTSSNGKKKIPFADEVAFPVQGLVTGIIQLEPLVLPVY